MKKLFVSLALGAAAAAGATSAFAAAADACTGAAGAGTQVTGATDGSTFVRVSFKPMCSANTLVKYDDQTTFFAVAAASSKGKSAFAGSTAGGAVKPDTTQTCPATGCTTTQVSGALSNAVTAGSSG